MLDSGFWFLPHTTMKRRLLGGVFALVVFATALCAGPRDSQWDQVNAAIQKGLPKTAIDQLEPIISGALADHAFAEAVKAVARKVTLEAYIQGDKPEERIVRMQAELEKAPAEMRPTMEALLAYWYWQ